ncbi:MAG: hypothetical protein IID43_00200, partial [Planctomycetes bacterium]|nr:hypothetical protein [Planctomycetota bacterium]
MANLVVVTGIHRANLKVEPMEIHQMVGRAGRPKIENGKVILSRGDAYVLLPEQELGELFGAAGIGDDITPVLYDGYDGRNSAMVAWALGYLGRDDVHVMDIVYDEWKAQVRAVLYRPVLREPRKST